MHWAGDGSPLWGFSGGSLLEGERRLEPTSILGASENQSGLYGHGSGKFLKDVWE